MFLFKIICSLNNFKSTAESLAVRSFSCHLKSNIMCQRHQAGDVPSYTEQQWKPPRAQSAVLSRGVSWEMLVQWNTPCCGQVSLGNAASALSLLEIHIAYEQSKGSTVYYKMFYLKPPWPDHGTSLLLLFHGWTKALQYTWETLNCVILKAPQKNCKTNENKLASN